MEYLDIVNDANEVVGQTSRIDAYANRYSLRIVHVLVENSQGKILFQQVNKNKPPYPLHWSTSCGGHVMAGESYEQAAYREFKEELGIQLASPEFISDLVFIASTGQKKFLRIFRTKHNGSFTPDPHEVERLAFFFPSEIQVMLSDQQKFAPELEFILRELILVNHA